MHGKTLKELAEHINAELCGDPDILITSASTLDNAQAGDITFLNNKKYTSQAAITKAGAIIVSEKVDTDAALLISKDPYYAFMQVVVMLHGHREHKKTGISSMACIASSACVGQNTDVHNFATLSDNVQIGSNCTIYPGVFIGCNTCIGDNCIVYPNAVIYNDCAIGSRVIVHSNAVIGQDGFGFATHDGVHHKIPHIGGVIIEDDVEIGSCCTIERGTLDDTLVGKGSKIGDMVAIGHGTKIGPYCLLVPQVGIAGSSTLGHHCVLGGQAGIVGHIKIGNLVRIGAQAGVVNDIPDGATVVGAPAFDAHQAKRAYSLIQYLPQMRKRLQNLEKKIAGQDVSDANGD